MLKTVKMRCGRKQCCPELSLDTQWLRVKDDFGNEIRIPARDRHAFQQSVDELIGDPGDRD